jgi:hypothetical protein
VGLPSRSHYRIPGCLIRKCEVIDVTQVEVRREKGRAPDSETCRSVRLPVEGVDGRSADFPRGAGPSRRIAPPHKEGRWQNLRPDLEAFHLSE